MITTQIRHFISINGEKERILFFIFEKQLIERLLVIFYYFHTIFMGNYSFITNPNLDKLNINLSHHRGEKPPKIGNETKYFSFLLLSVNCVIIV